MSVGPRGARGRSAGLSPPSQPGSPLFRGPWRRPCRTAGGVEHRGSGASVLRGLHPSSRHPAGLSLKAPQGKGGWQRVHRSAPRRDTAWGEEAARSRSQKALLRGEGEGAVCGSWGPRGPPDPRGAGAVLCLTQCGLAVAQEICHARGHDPLGLLWSGCSQRGTKAAAGLRGLRPRAPHTASLQLC